MVATSLFRSKNAVAIEAERVGIIDIGSNSIRLVVFHGPERAPAILFNEKVMAGLGRGLSQTGALDPQAMEKALTALARFRLLAEQMQVAKLRTVATAAVRDASNGKAFLDRLVQLGLVPELLSGDQEAVMAGYGVISAIPEACGIVGDLGGGSLELARVADGEVHERISLPLGVLRIAALRAKGATALDRHLRKMLAKADWIGKCAGQPFYLVGGSWRSLARLDMHLRNYPLPIVHHYHMAPEQPQRLVRVLAHIGPKKLRDVIGLSTPRIPNLADSAALLTALIKHIKPGGLVVSANGLREGLIYSALDAETKAIDPLICTAREEGQLRGRFREHGDLLERWIAPLFEEEEGEEARLRHATCLLADIGWRAHPEFRAERGLDIGLHGNWIGLDARGRAMIAHALYVSFGGSGRTETVTQLAGDQDLTRAERWGLAIRLGQRLSGGVALALKSSALVLTESAVQLEISSSSAPLIGDSVERRLKVLATAMGRVPETIVTLIN